jgi:ribosomal protein S18
MFRALLIKNFNSISTKPSTTNIRSRLIHVSSLLNVKKIERTIDNNNKTITIEGVYLDSDKISGNKFLKLNKKEKENENTNNDMEENPAKIRPCVLCELEKKNIFVQYTDILVLRQFLREDGTLLNRKITGLCKKQQKKLYTIVKHAKYCGLLMNLQPPKIDGSKPDIDPRKRFEHLQFNAYFEDYEIMKKKYKYI